MESRILILGYLGLRSGKIDGQTIKTREILKLFQMNAGKDWQVIYYDTENLRKGMGILSMFAQILKSNKVVYLPGRANFKIIMPFVFIFCKIFSKEIIYIVVGGWLADFIKPLKLHQRILKQFKNIYVESSTLKQKLFSNYGIKKVHQIPNFRIHNFMPDFQKTHSDFKIAFMSRISESKGIHRIFRFAEWYSSKKNNKRIKIHFYGPIDSDEEEKFFAAVKTHPSISYKGVTEPHKVHEILCQYDCLVLPSNYDGEGFPGAIIDSYIAGIPVIVSNWKQLPEFVDFGETGYYFDLDNEEIFYEQIYHLINNEDVLLEMKKKSFKKSKSYSAEAAWNTIKSDFI